MKIVLSKRLKELRTQEKLTQKQLAEKLKIHPVTYLHYEKGEHEPPLELLADIAKLYGVSVDYLLGLEN